MKRRAMRKNTHHNAFTKKYASRRVRCIAFEQAGLIKRHGIHHNANVVDTRRKQIERSIHV